jgi:nucleoside phosphorylase
MPADGMDKGDAQRFSTEPSPEESTGTDGRPVDVLVITALQEELEAVLALGENGRAGWRDLRDPEGFRYHRRAFPTARGGQLEIAAAWTDMGERATALRGLSLLTALDPACITMCGICAGHPEKTSLGDVIIADRVFGFDEGKRVAGTNGVEFFHDLRTFGPKAVWKTDAAYLARELDLADLVRARPPSKDAQRWWLLHTLHAHEAEGGPAPVSHPERVRACPGWTALVKDAMKGGLVAMTGSTIQLTDAGRDKVLKDRVLHPDGLPPLPPLRVHVAPVATVKAVQEDPAIWDRIHHVERKTLGLDMEGSAIGDLAERRDKSFLFVKAVSDYADHDKDDSFRMFACRASATVLLAFLQKHLEPRRDGGLARVRNGATRSTIVSCLLAASVGVCFHTVASALAPATTSSPMPPPSSDTASAPAVPVPRVASTSAAAALAANIEASKPAPVGEAADGVHVYRDASHGNGPG